MNKPRVLLLEAPELNAYRLLVIEDRADGAYLFAHNSWQKLDMDSTTSGYEPTLTLQWDWVQALYNEMVAKGFRATESERERRAVERHLDDVIKERDRIFDLLTEAVIRRLK